MGRKRKLSVNPNQTFLDFMTENPNGKDLVNAYIDLDKHAEQLEEKRKIPIYNFCPRHSILEHVVDITVAETDLPPSLTYHSSVTMLGAALTQQGFYCLFPDGKKLPPNLWTIALAPSGAGKTWTRDNLAEPIIGQTANLVTLPETITSAALFQFLSTTGLSMESDNQLNEEEKTRLINQRCKALFCRDEVGEFIQQINKNDTYAELKDMLLRAYDGKSLSKATLKQGERTTPEIALSFLGTAPDQTFFKSLTEADFLNGFFQRFLMVIADDRPSHRISWYTTHGKEEALKQFQTTWALALNGTREYVISKPAFVLFDSWFHEKFKQSKESYFRRYAFSAFKYALILKVISEPDGRIDVPIMDKALSIVDRHLSDLYLIMKDYTHLNDWFSMMRKIEIFLENNPESTRSGIRQGIRNIGSVQEMDRFLETIADSRVDSVGKQAMDLLNGKRKRVRY